ncbi:MAG: type I polyketide synthase [Spirulina sp. SIO3F2]|nr:type I polyketide synthase [Spirulina sp. SIO3F2]
MQNNQAVQARYARAQDLANSSQTSSVQNLDAIAIVGLGCRFPGGADSPQTFWQLLQTGQDAICEVPSDRWQVDQFYDPELDSNNTMNTRWGGFIDGVEQFDPVLFGLSTAEAAAMDPQQRLLLEVSWEALENAGLAPDRLAGSKTGVFIGSWVYDYYKLLRYSPSRGGTGVASGMTANRLSHVYDFRGPSISVDTACSSSLVAVHTACQSLRTQDSDLAIAGGVNLILAPNWTIALSQAGMMAADGRSKTFDHRADGYVRGEGCGIVVLKRLADAQAAGDPILAVIRGSAINQDGRTKGITAPNGEAQQAVIREALERAQVMPEQIDYVEAHGTGTPLGDKTEVQSLVAVLEEGRSPDQRCFLGSVKANIGHLEAAAGIAGLIKATLCLQQGEVPPQLHIQQLNPALALPLEKFAIATPQQPYTQTQPLRFAGVNSFGYGGTNAHIILEVAPQPKTQRSPEIERPEHLFCLAAKKEKTLKTLAQLYIEYLEAAPTTPLADLCFSVNTSRAHLESRLAVIADSTQDLKQHLQAFIAGESAEGLVTDTQKNKQAEPPKIAFLFSGQGSQYVEMGRELYETQPTFRKTLDYCDAFLRPKLQRSLLSVLYPTAADAPDLANTAYSQPALFALEYALAQLWQQWGIEPDVVMGHSIGEYTAACVAGAFSLETGLTLVAERGRLMAELPPQGAMAAVFAEREAVEAVIAPFAAQVSIAAVNSPTQVVISGETEAIASVIANLEDDYITCQPLNVSHGFHSHLMEPMLAEFADFVAQFDLEVPRLPLVSNLTGEVLPQGKIQDATYWCNHIRQGVQFEQGIQTLQQMGYGIFLEVGPHHTLRELGKRCVPKKTGQWLTSLHKKQGNWRSLLIAIQTLYTQGIAIDWVGFDQDYPRQRLQLPNYPFQRKRCWLDESELQFYGQD